MRIKWDRLKGRPEPIRALNRVRELENHDPLVDIRSVAPSVKIYRETAIPYCRAEVAEMAEKAAQSLPDGVFLALLDAWRPFIRQVRIYEWMSQCLMQAYPNLSYGAMRRRVCRWVAPVDQKAPPGHCTGAALDVALVNAENELIDITSPFGRFEASPTYIFGLSDEAARNRHMMVEAMLSAGFSNCRDEYWHYSYGDAGWAVREGLDECVYGLVELPESIWEQKQVEWEAGLKDRPNPFLDQS